MTDDTKIVNENQQTPRINSRDNDVQNGSAPITVSLETIDTAIIGHLSKRIRPIVTQNGVQATVPVMYGDPERWKSTQKDGVLRDSMGKIQLPLLMIRRGSMKKTSINSAVNKYYDRSFSTGWNRRNPYDQFAAINKVTPSREYFNTTSVPDYYEITYKCIIWTEYMDQMNQVVENISFESDEFWGEPNSYKFRSIIKSFEPMNELPIDSDRVVRMSFDMTVFAYLIPKTMLDEGHTRGNVTRKRYGIKKVVTFTEVDE